MKKLLVFLAAVLSFTAVIFCFLFTRSFSCEGVGNINPPTGDYLNHAIYASLGVLVVLIVLFFSAARSKRRK